MTTGIVKETVHVAGVLKRIGALKMSRFKPQPCTRQASALSIKRYEFLSELEANPNQYLCGQADLREILPAAIF